MFTSAGGRQEEKSCEAELNSKEESHCDAVQMPQATRYMRTCTVIVNIVKCVNLLVIHCYVALYPMVRVVVFTLSSYHFCCVVLH